MKTAEFNEVGKMLYEETICLDKREGKEDGNLISGEIIKSRYQASAIKNPIKSIGISVPGIYHSKSGRGLLIFLAWNNYLLLMEI